MEKYKIEDVITLMENRQQDQFEKMKEQAVSIYENIQPINLLKNTIQEIAMPSENNHLNIIQNFIGVATGFISKKLFIGKSNNPIKSIIGTLIEIKLANYLSNKLSEKK